MKKLRNFVILLSFLPATYFSQGLAVNMGYDYMSRSAGFIGADYRINSSHDSSLTVGVGTFLLNLDHKFTILPEAHITYGTIAFVEASATTKNFKPTVGLSLFNIVQMKFGYSFPFDKRYDLRGFTFGLHFFIGKESFYDSFDVGF